MPEAVEGQDVALEIFGDTPERGWEAFRERYEAQLIRRAESILSRAPTLRSFGQAEDLVQGFLTEQVISHPEAMLSPTARGEKPLWPRLSRSFTNYCIQILRRLARRPRLVSDDTIEVEAVDDVSEAGDHGEVWTSIVRRIHERQDTIRLAFSEQESGMVPLLHLLLLSERLFLSHQIETSFAETDPHPPLGIPIPELVSRIAPWGDDELRRNLPARDIPLGDVWVSLTRPTLRTDGGAVAQVLGVRRNRWDQWIRRARLRVVDRIGPEKLQRLFPHWPERLTTEATRLPGEQGGS